MKLFPISVSQSLDPHERQMKVAISYIDENGKGRINVNYLPIPDDYVTKSVQEFTSGQISKMSLEDSGWSVAPYIELYNPFPKSNEEKC